MGRNNYYEPKRLLKYILIAMISGILVGWACHSSVSTAQATDIASYFKIVTDVFLRLIKMIIAPLVFATIVSGLISMGKSSSGSITVNMSWFIGASFISLLLGGTCELFPTGCGNESRYTKGSCRCGCKCIKLKSSNIYYAYLPA
jgi:Na+/H+-dicarboxylate symporter